MLAARPALRLASGWRGLACSRHSPQLPPLRAPVSPWEFCFPRVSPPARSPSSERMGSQDKIPANIWQSKNLTIVVPIIPRISAWKKVLELAYPNNIRIYLLSCTSYYRQKSAEIQHSIKLIQLIVWKKNVQCNLECLYLHFCSYKSTLKDSMPMNFLLVVAGAP